MKALLDACVLYPTVMREVLSGAAEAGLFEPLYSARILEEWARAAGRSGAGDEARARGEIALLRARFADGEVSQGEGPADLWLPDPNDVHVLASAIAGGAEVLVTLNAGDFPAAALAPHGIVRRHPDAFLIGFWPHAEAALRAVAQAAQQRIERASGQSWPMRKLMKKAGLPRLGKQLDGG